MQSTRQEATAKMNAANVLGDVIPGVSNQQPQAEIFKLKVDHFEELFDWLSLKDLVALGQTCKRMQHIVGYWIKINYAAVKFESRKDGIAGPHPEINLNGLSSFLKKIIFHYLEHVPYDHWGRQWRAPGGIIDYMKANQFKSLTEILLTRVVLTDAGIERIKDILSQLETVKLKFPHFLDENQEFYDGFLQFCTNVNRLCIQGSSNTSIVSGDNTWLRQKYPTLEHFELIMNEAGPIVGLETFFEQNANVKTFATNIEVISANSDTLKNIKLKLDILSVDFCHANTLHSSPDLLNDLYGSGLFNELHVYFFTLYNSTFNPESVDALISLKGLTKLYIDGMEDGTDLSPLINLKQLYVNRASSISNMTMLATKLIHLEFIQFTYANIDDILPFVRHSIKLTKIAVHRLDEKDKVILKVGQLNTERSKLSNARKVTIYVNESVYLAVKWAKNQTNWNLIEIKRGESYVGLNHNFDYLDDSDKSF